MGDSPRTEKEKEFTGGIDDLFKGHCYNDDIVSKAQASLLKHMLGDGTFFRNHFVAGKGQTDLPELWSMQELGLVYLSPNPPCDELMGGDRYLFHVTAHGKRIAKALFDAEVNDKVAEKVIQELIGKPLDKFNKGLEDIIDVIESEANRDKVIKLLHERPLMSPGNELVLGACNQVINELRGGKSLGGMVRFLEANSDIRHYGIPYDTDPVATEIAHEIITMIKEVANGIPNNTD